MKKKHLLLVALMVTVLGGCEGMRPPYGNGGYTQYRYPNGLNNPVVEAVDQWYGGPTVGSSDWRSFDRNRSPHGVVNFHVRGRANVRLGSGGCC
jgi:hypothetical protein